MTRKERALYISDELNRIYPSPSIPLRHRDPYTLLIAVVLSAQCTDKRVNRTTPGLFALADSPAAMAQLPVSRIEEVIRSCGLSNNKAKAISGLSRMLVSKHQGRVPSGFLELEALPGVGHKTASVLMVQAFGRPAFPVDTHIHRLAQRWGLSNGRNVGQTEADLKRIFPRDSWARLHLQIIYYGREFCTARGCNGTVCPICRTCYPRRKKPVVTRKA